MVKIVKYTKNVTLLNAKPGMRRKIIISMLMDVP